MCILELSFGKVGGGSPLCQNCHRAGTFSPSAYYRQRSEWGSFMAVLPISPLSSPTRLAFQMVDDWRLTSKDCFCSKHCSSRTLNSAAAKMTRPSAVSDALCCKNHRRRHFFYRRRHILIKPEPTPAPDHAER
jgi:hypothetical protein